MSTDTVRPLPEQVAVQLRNGTKVMPMEEAVDLYLQHPDSVNMLVEERLTENRRGGGQHRFTSAEKARIRAQFALSAGYTITEFAKLYGVSRTTMRKLLREELGDSAVAPQTADPAPDAGTRRASSSTQALDAARDNAVRRVLGSH